ncbi:hypothetical protein ACF0H5_015889 [Mactra antiquata]
MLFEYKPFISCWIMLHIVDMINCNHGILQVVMTGHSNTSVEDVCPNIACSDGEYIPKECRKSRFIIGYDGQTKCRVCDDTFCGKLSEVCPQLDCPKNSLIPEDCRRPKYTIGTDGITRCKLCDVNICGDPVDVCPSIKALCPSEITIPYKCRREQYMIGSDGITMCKVCTKNGCRKNEENNYIVT